MNTRNKRSPKIEKKTYSWIAAVFTILAASNAWLYLFSQKSILWVLVGAAIINTCICLTIGINNLIQLLALKSIGRTLFIRINSILIFISAIYGLLEFVNKLNLTDVSHAFIPFIIFSLYFAGASIGIYQIDRHI